MRRKLHRQNNSNKNPLEKKSTRKISTVKHPTRKNIYRIKFPARKNHTMKNRIRKFHQKNTPFFPFVFQGDQKKNYHKN